MDQWLAQAEALANRAGVFGPIGRRDGMLVCQAKGSAAPASYRVLWDRDRLYVALVMADRWLSESIETDLLHTGDKVEDLVRDELMELVPGITLASLSPLACEHFRSSDLLFTFRTPVPDHLGPMKGPPGDIAGTLLLGYEAAFRHLGDMSGGDDD